MPPSKPVSEMQSGIYIEIYPTISIDVDTDLDPDSFGSVDPDSKCGSGASSLKSLFFSQEFIFVRDFFFMRANLLGLGSLKKSKVLFLLFKKPNPPLPSSRFYGLKSGNR